MIASNAPTRVASPISVLTPTGLEYWAAHLVLGGRRVRRVGVGLAECPQLEAGSIVILCGLAGALVPGLNPGAVMIPEEVTAPDGSTLRCDPDVTAALRSGARALSLDPHRGRLLTAPTLVTGAARQEWAARGFVAADMETGLLMGHDLRVATVRVILDSPQRAISDRWLSPARALLRPALWPELLWLCRAAPACSLRAARVVQGGLDRLPHPSSDVQ